MICSRTTILAVALCVLAARVTGLHLHLCLHEEGPQSELHTFTHEDLGCEQPNGPEPEPADVEVGADDSGVVKTLKVAFDLPALTALVAGLPADSLPNRVRVAAQAPATDFNRALRPPLRGPPV